MPPPSPPVLRRIASKSLSTKKLFNCSSTSRRVATSAMNTPKSLEGFIQRAKECNTGLEEISNFIPFQVGGKLVGRLRPQFAQQLSRFPEVFQEVSTGGMEIHPNLSTVDARSKAVATVLGALRSEGVITGWRDELYPVTASFYEDPCMLVERAAATHLGIKAYGVHVNGYVQHKDGSKSLWVARRSKDKPNWPGKLDHIAAGGQPHGISPTENVIKECSEEASIPWELARQAKPVGAVCYTTISATGYKPDVLFCYDICLPENFQPAPQDGEVEYFKLMTMDEVAEIVSYTTDFKTNCCLVIADFMIRHGYITPEQPGYLELVSLLRVGDCC